ncbi:MAG: DNA-directed RNA polymerase subunit delta [Bacilli bacterium]
MELKKMSKEEIELMSYTDITYQLFKENKKPMNTAKIFKKICKLLGYDEDAYQTKIGDYYTSLTLDKRFILLPNGNWDVRDHHAISLLVDDDDDDELEETVSEETDEEVDDDEDKIIDDDDDIEDDDLAELAIIKDEEIDGEMNR